MALTEICAHYRRASLLAASSSTGADEAVARNNDDNDGGGGGGVELQLLAEQCFNEVRGKNLALHCAVNVDDVRRAPPSTGVAFAAASAVFDALDELCDSVVLAQTVRVSLPDALAGRMAIDEHTAASIELVRNLNDGVVCSCACLCSNH